MSLRWLVLSVFGFGLSTVAIALPLSLHYLQVDHLSVEPSFDGSGSFDVVVAGTTSCQSGDVQDLQIYADPTTRVVRVVALAELVEGDCTAREFELQTSIQLAPGPWTLTTNHGRTRVYVEGQLPTKKPAT